VGSFPFLGRASCAVRAWNRNEHQLRFHLEAYSEELIRRGMPPKEAMRRARLEFGGSRSKRRCRRRGANFFESLLQDLRYGLRMRQSPHFRDDRHSHSGARLGATTAMFSIINAVLLRPLAYAAR